MKIFVFRTFFSTRMPRPRTKKSILPPKPLQNTEAQTLLFVGNERGEIHLLYVPLSLKVILQNNDRPCLA